MKQSIKPSKVAVGVLGGLLGIFIVLALRFVTYKLPPKTHYHANFAVYVNGQQEQFDNPLLYEEITMCSNENFVKPEERAHLHDKIKDVVHVEDMAVTWGNFFQNIGWGAGKDYLDTSDALLINSDTKKVTYILNGKVVNNVASKIIADGDRLLVSYGGSTTDQLDQQFATVATSAEKYNVEKDPASCGAGHLSPTLRERFEHIF